MIDIVLKKKREKPALEFHPWIFSGAVKEVRGQAKSGDVVRVLDSQNNFLAYGHFSACSEIQVRLLEWDEKTKINEEWLFHRIRIALELRKGLFSSDSMRLVYSESDYLPGLIVDRYKDHVVLETLTFGMDQWKTTITIHLTELLGVKGIFEKNDTDSRKREGLPMVCSLLSGSMPASPFIISENGSKYIVDIVHGQKTGFYLDQRDNRPLVANFALGRDVLDCFSYTGGFAIPCLRNNARSVLRVDSSASALETGDQNLRLNDFSPLLSDKITGNAFEVLRKMRDENRKFDMIILDPPKLAPAASQLPKALRAYKDINLLALKLLKPLGVLATFSCSSALDMPGFKKVLKWASHDARVDVQVLHQLSQAQDHPVRLSFPESEYLKGLILRVLGK